MKGLLRFFSNGIGKGNKGYGSNGLRQLLTVSPAGIQTEDKNTISLGSKSFNLCNPLIDGVLIGVDNAAQLQADLASAASARAIDLDINVTKRELLNPVNWK